MADDLFALDFDLALCARVMAHEREETDALMEHAGPMGAILASLAR
jgi:hypothetical protein